jgi:hypothetical protein
VTRLGRQEATVVAGRERGIGPLRTWRGPGSFTVQLLWPLHLGLALQWRDRTTITSIFVGLPQWKRRP